ncbi:MAG: FAD-dependent oxidoreductase [Bdellovibrionaceae bacterium]|nr:FAD-dependent oxidoreductase [Pseudobdellovibrionaceae bacterium]|tara:strand:- start:76986 stop:78170 length:1185 start_codon:yes stop_codon:yes gene_type:complete
MSVSYWLDTSRSNSAIDVDVCVVGAGVAGASACYWLAKEDPNLSIRLIDKGAVASGATGRNAGFITCGSVEHFHRLCEFRGKEEALKIWQFSEENLNLLRSEIIENCELNIGFEEKGSFSLASTEEELAGLKHTAELMDEFGIHVEMVDEPGVRSRVGAEDFVGGIKYCDDASVHPVKLVEAILERTSLIAKDFKVLPFHEVYSIEEQDGRQEIKTQKVTLNCDLVVLGTNAYSKVLFNYFEDKIYPTRGQILMTEPVAPFMEGPCYANFVLDYFRQLPSGEMIIGGFRQLQKDSEIGYDDQTSPVIQSALEEFLQKHVPAIRGKKITHRWAGIMGFSADGQPMIGALPANNQVYFLGGFTAHGLGLAFHSGKCLTDMIFGREIPEFISARRFS